MECRIEGVQPNIDVAVLKILDDEVDEKRTTTKTGEE